LIDALLRRGGAHGAEERHDVFLCLGAAACERLRRLHRDLHLDTRRTRTAWNRVIRDRGQRPRSADQLLDLAERAGVLHSEGGNGYAFRKTQFRDCIAAVAEDCAGLIGPLNPLAWPHLLYVAGLSANKAHRAKLLNSRVVQDTYLQMGKLLTADYAIEVRRGGGDWRGLMGDPEGLVSDLAQLFHADDGLDMKRAVLRRLRELDPTRALSLLQEQRRGSNQRWRTAATVELADALDTEDAGTAVNGDIRARQDLRRSARAVLSARALDALPDKDLKGALLDLRSDDEDRLLDALHDLINRDLPPEIRLSADERRILGSRRFWRASRLPGTGPCAGTSHHGPAEARRLFALLLADALRFHTDPEISYLITQALAKLPLLPELLRIDPIPRSAVWALALRYGFLVQDRREIVRIDVQTISVDGTVERHLRPVPDWSAQAWRLG
jgi:hypothetical protein